MSQKAELDLKITSGTPEEVFSDPTAKARIAHFVEASYLGKSPQEIGPLSPITQHKAIEGIVGSENVRVLEAPDGSIASLLATTIHTREGNPDFYARIEKKLANVKEDIRSKVQETLGSIDGFVYTHEMVTGVSRRRRGDIKRLRDEALADAGLSLDSSRIGFIGEFQGMHSMGVQVNIPGSISILAGEHIQSRNAEIVHLNERKLSVMQALAHIVGQTYMEHYYPTAVVHPDGTVTSSVFVLPPPTPNYLSDPKTYGAARKIWERQVLTNGVASAIGATFINMQ